MRMISYIATFGSIYLCVYLQVICSHVFCAPPHKDLTGHLLNLALLAVRDFHITPPPVNHVPLGKHAHLRLVATEPDEAKALGILGFVNTRWLDKSQFNPKNELDKAHYAKTSIVLEKKRKEEEENEKKEKEGKKKKSNVNKALGHVSH